MAKFQKHGDQKDVKDDSNLGGNDDVLDDSLDDDLDEEDEEQLSSWETEAELEE